MSETLGSFQFSFIKDQINCVHNAIDLDNNEYGVMIHVDIVKNQVKQGQNIIGDCIIDDKIVQRYSKLNFDILLNITKINWFDTHTDRIHLKSMVTSVLQIYKGETKRGVKEKSVGVIKYNISELQSGVTQKKRDLLLSGKVLSDRDWVLNVAKMHVLSKW